MSMQNRQHAHASAQQIINPNRRAHAHQYLLPAQAAIVLPTNELVLDYSEMQLGRATELILYGADAVSTTWKRVKNLLIPNADDHGANKLILPVSMDADEQKGRRHHQGSAQEDERDGGDSADRAVDSMSRSIRQWLWE